LTTTPAPTPTAVPTADLSRLYGIGEIDRSLIRLVPTYGGLIPDPEQDALVVFLTDPEDQEVAEKAIAQVSGADGIPPGGVQVREADYTMAQLSAWYTVARQVVWPIANTLPSDLNEGRKRILFGVVTEYGKAQAQQALAEAGIP